MIALLFSLALGWAQTSDSQVTTFKWTASGTLDLTVVKNGQSVSFPRTNLREAAGEVAEMDAGGLHAVVTTYAGFVAVVFGKSGGDAELILMERKNAAFEVISDPIPGRLAEMPEQLKYIIKRYAELQGTKPEDVSGVFRSMVAYFDANPRKQLRDYADEAERATDIVKLVQKPPTKVADQPAVQTGPAPSTVARQPAPAPTRPRVVAQPRPRPDPYYQQQDPYGYPPQRQARRPQPRPPGLDNFFGMFD